MKNFFHFVHDPQTERDKLHNGALSALVFAGITILYYAAGYFVNDYFIRRGWYMKWVAVFYLFFLLMRFVRYRKKLGGKNTADND